MPITAAFEIVKLPILVTIELSMSIIFVRLPDMRSMLVSEILTSVADNKLATGTLDEMLDIFTSFIDNVEDRTRTKELVEFANVIFDTVIEESKLAMIRG